MPVKVDIVILSYAKTDELKRVTLNGVESLFASEDPAEVQFEVFVIESNKGMQPYQYPGTTTIYPDVPFGFNKYLNIGINASDSDYVCLNNNDLIYHKNWATEILKAMQADSNLLSATTYCPLYHKDKFEQNSGNVEGYIGVLMGWCIFVKREIFDIIGQLDEKFVFWYCDNDYCLTLQKYHVKNELITSSLVTHLGSESLKATADKKEVNRLTQLPRVYFNYKWGKYSLLRYWLMSVYVRLSFLINKA